MSKPSPLKDKSEQIRRLNLYDGGISGRSYVFLEEEVAALKAWLESKNCGARDSSFIWIDKKDWIEGWSDVND